jgi:hypothetical protein
MIEFQAWPKTPRLFRDMIVTEKIDGTNAAVIIEELTTDNCDEPPAAGEKVVFALGDRAFIVGAQSRKRLICPDSDNFGFAKWVWDNAESLAAILGPGRHYGEWWGSGIQRGYGLTNGEKRFSLFNVKRYDFSGSKHADFGLRAVPTLYSGPFNLDVVEGLLAGLMNHGSHAAPGFMRPEGVVVFHEAAGQVFKATLDNDEAPKGLAA